MKKRSEYNGTILADNNSSQEDKQTNYIEINYSELWDLIGAVSVGSIPLVIMFFLAMNKILTNLYSVWFFLGWVFIFCCPLIFLILGLFIKGYDIAKCVITNLKIEFYLNNRLYLDISWKSIEKILLIKEEYDTTDLYGSSKWAGFKLDFIGHNLNKSIRLYCCHFYYRKQELIINSLKEFSSFNVCQIVFEESIGKHFNSKWGKNSPCSNLSEFRKKKR